MTSSKTITLPIEAFQRIQNELLELKAANSVLEAKIVEERGQKAHLRVEKVANLFQGLARRKMTPPTSDVGWQDKLQWFEIREERRKEARNRLKPAVAWIVEINMESCQRPTPRDVDQNLSSSTRDLRNCEDDNFDDIMKVATDSETEFSKHSMRTPPSQGSTDSCIQKQKLSAINASRRPTKSESARRSKSVDFQTYEAPTSAAKVAPSTVTSGHLQSERLLKEGSSPFGQCMSRDTSHLEAVIREQTERIHNLEEVLARRDQQVLQLAETMTDFRKEIDGSDCGSMMKQINNLESRLSFALKHEADLEAELKETIRKFDQVYELEAAIKRLKITNVNLLCQIESTQREIDYLRRHVFRLQHVLIQLDRLSSASSAPKKTSPMLEKGVGTTEKRWPSEVENLLPTHISVSQSTSPASPAESSDGLPPSLSPGSSPLLLGSSLSVSKGNSGWAMQRRALHMLLKKEKRLRCDAERKVSELLSSHLETSTSLSREAVRSGSQESLLSFETARTASQRPLASSGAVVRRKGKADAVVEFAGTTIFDFT